MHLSASLPKTPGGSPRGIFACALRAERCSLFLVASLVTLVATGSIPLHAQATFVPPQQQPMERYEAAWGKNPFTRKTAPVVAEVQSFAKDLAIGSMYQVGDETTVVVVNIKTRERTILRGNAPSTSGMRVKEASIKDTRKDSTAIVEQGNQQATLHYDASYLKQIAGSATTAQKTRGNRSGTTKDEHGVASNWRAQANGNGGGNGNNGADSNPSSPASSDTPSPFPPGYVNSNLDAEPGDPTAIVESAHGVGRQMTFDQGQGSTPPTAPPGIPAISTNLDAEPGTAPPPPPEDSMTTPQPPNPAPPPAVGEP